VKHFQNTKHEANYNKKMWVHYLTHILFETAADCTSMPHRLHWPAMVCWMWALGQLSGAFGRIAELFGKVCGAAALGRGGVGLGMSLAVGAWCAPDAEEDDMAMLVSMGARLPICLGILSMGARLPTACDGSVISLQAAPMQAPG
jgi:hypothetical protein